MGLNTKRQQNVSRSPEKPYWHLLALAVTVLSPGSTFEKSYPYTYSIGVTLTHGFKTHGDPPASWRPGAFAFPMQGCPVPGRGSRPLSSFPPSPGINARAPGRGELTAREDQSLPLCFRLCRIRE